MFLFRFVNFAIEKELKDNISKGGVKVENFIFLTRPNYFLGRDTRAAQEKFRNTGEMFYSFTAGAASNGTVCMIK